MIDDVLSLAWTKDDRKIIQKILHSKLGRPNGIPVYEVERLSSCKNYGTWQAKANQVLREACIAHRFRTYQINKKQLNNVRMMVLN